MSALTLTKTMMITKSRAGDVWVSYTSCAARFTQASRGRRASQWSRSLIGSIR
jgi:hypothetical protein